MCFTVIALKAIAEMALLFHLAQYAVRVLSFGRHEANPVYLGLRFLTSPFSRIGGSLVPGAAGRRHASLLGFAVGLVLWMALVLAKQNFHCAPSS